MKPQIILKSLITLSVIFFLNSCAELYDREEKDPCKIKRTTVYLGGELLVKGSTMWQISVANQNGAMLDADKNCHAQMTLEFWFKDKNLAKTNAKPPISMTFFGGGGFFDPGSVATYIGQRMPDSSYYWTAYCDQAAKNAPSNPIDYGILVTWDINQSLFLEDVVLEGKIDYKIYETP